MVRDMFSQLSTSEDPVPTVDVVSQSLANACEIIDNLRSQIESLTKDNEELVRCSVRINKSNKEIRAKYWILLRKASYGCFNTNCKVYDRGS